MKIYLTLALSALLSFQAWGEDSRTVGQSQLNAPIIFGATDALPAGSPVSTLKGIADLKLPTIESLDWHRNVETKTLFTEPVISLINYTAETTSTDNQDVATPAVSLMAIDLNPSKPKNVTATYSGGKVTFRWDEVTTNIDLEPITGVTYRLTIQKNGESQPVIKGITTNSYEYPVSLPANGETDRYLAFLCAEHNGLTSSEADMKEPLWVTNINAPWSDSLCDSFSPWKVFDVQEDGNTWMSTGDSEFGRRIHTKDGATDDWLISPPMNLEANHYYLMSIQVGTWSYWSETFDCAIGRECDPAAMTTTLLQPTTLMTYYRDGYNTYEMEYIPTESGEYYFGIHANPGMVLIYARNFVLNAGLLPGAPARGEMSVNADFDGALSASVRYTCPSKTIDGNPVGTITKVEFYRDGELIATKTSGLRAGRTITTSDNDITEVGYHTYKVMSYNATGEGIANTVKRYVGIPVPGAPENVTLTRTEKEGELEITWDAPSKDVDGYDMNPELMTYTVYGYQGNNLVPLGKDMKERSMKIQAVAEGQPQAYMQYYVTATTECGEGEYGYSNLCVAGKPYDLPLYQDWGIGYSNVWAIDASAPVMYTFSTAENVGVEAPPTDDETILLTRAQYDNDYINLTSGQINIPADAKNPVLTFCMWSNGSSDANITTVSANGKKIWSSYGFEVNPEQGWGIVRVDLSSLKGQTVLLNWGVDINTHVFWMIDGIRIEETSEKDLTLHRLIAPGRIKPGEKGTITMTVRNNGSTAVSNYTLELYANDRLLQTRAADSSLAPGYRATFEFEDEFTPAYQPETCYRGVVVWDEDEDVTNNEKTADSKLLVPMFPTARNLSGELLEDKNTVRLTWDDPDMNFEIGDDATRTESFESYDSWQMENLGLWQSIDNDRYPINGINGFEWPGMTTGESTVGFFIFDSKEYYETTGSRSEYYRTEDGDKMIVTISASNQKALDDWLISPRLSGNAQTISFRARGVSQSYVECMKIYYSTTGTDIADFKDNLVYNNTWVDSKWTDIKASLPEGAKYFAIQNCGESNFLLMIDKIEYEIGNQWSEFTLKEFNVYRDGRLIGTTKDRLFDDATADTEEQEHTYVVTAVYDRHGEAGASNEVRVSTFSAIEEIIADENLSNGMPKYYNLQGMRVTAPSAGIYIRVAGGKAEKVYVK